MKEQLYCCTKDDRALKNKVKLKDQIIKNMINKNKRTKEKRRDQKAKILSQKDCGTKITNSQWLVQSRPIKDQHAAPQLCTI